MQQVSAVGVVAIGAMFAIITGGIDFSAGYGLAMIGMAAGVVYAQSPFQGSVAAMVVTFLGMGALFGLVNGLLIAALLIPCSLYCDARNDVAGAGHVADDRRRYDGYAHRFADPGGRAGKDRRCAAGILCGAAGRLPDGVAIPTGQAFASIHTPLAATRTPRGTAVSTSNGIKFWYTLWLWICTGIASMLTVSRIAMATPSISGTTLTDAIAATCIGGTSMSGGRGNVLGTCIGAR